MPAYHHGSEVETVRRAGFDVRFYGEGPVDEPDEAELESLVGPRTRALYLIHALGLPLDGGRWRQWCERRDLLLIEDGAQAWLSGSNGSAVGASGHVAIFCLYKMVGIPDGGAVWTDGNILPAPHPAGPAGGSLRAAARLHRAFLASRSPRFAPLLKGAATAHLRSEEPGRDFAADTRLTPPTRASAQLAPRVGRACVAERRRRNFRALRERLREHLSPAFGALGDEACPLAFPVETRDKQGMLEHLAGCGVIDGQLWEVPHPLLPVERFTRAARLRGHLVGLPLHHELREVDVERIAAAAEAWFQASGA